MHNAVSRGFGKYSFSKLRNPTGQFFQIKKQQTFCAYINAIISKVFVKIDYILKKIYNLLGQDKK